MLHYDQGHQTTERTMSLLYVHFYWNTMYADATTWVQKCERGMVIMGLYIQPNPTQGSLVANNPLDLVCLDFTKVDPSRASKKS